MKPTSIPFLSLALALALGCAEPGAPNDPAGGQAGPKADDITENGHLVDVQSLWVEQSATPGKQFLAIMDADLFTHSEHFLMFGEKSGNLRVRSFVGRFLIIEHPGHTETAKDNFYSLTAEFIDSDTVDVTLVGLNGSTFNLTYKRQPPDADKTLALAAADKFYAKYVELLEHDVETLADLKAYLRLHMRTHDYAPNDDADAALPWQFVFEWLQIEADFELSGANDDLAGVAIEADGSDAISAHFEERFGQGWTDPIDVPDPEDALDDFDFEIDEEEPVFYVFEEGIEGLENGPVKDGLELFADYTITAMHPFECEGGFDYTRDYYWVLADGSIFSYQTMPECD